jgi:hypothetical protein
MERRVHDDGRRQVTLDARNGSAKTPPFRVFCSYSHADREYKERLVRSLAALRREGVITEWDDTQIDAGEERWPAIRAELDSADVILLLVSADFLHSDFCYGEEMTRALQRHDEGTALVIPVLAKPADWKGAPFAKLQVLPSGAKPLAEWKPLDKGFADVAVRIRQALVGEASRPPGGQVPVVPHGGAAGDRFVLPYSKLAALAVGLVMLASVVALVVADEGEETPVERIGDPSPAVTTTVPIETTTAAPSTTVASRGPATTRSSGAPPPVGGTPTTTPTPSVTTSTTPTTSTTAAPTPGEWEAWTPVDLTGRCSDTRNVANLHWQVCVIGSRGALVVSVSSGGNHYVATMRISTVVNGSFTQGKACRTRIVVPGDRIVCYAETRPSTPGQQVRAYGGVVHDTVIEAEIYSPVVTL